MEGVIEREDGLKHLSPTYAAAFVGLTRAGEMLARELDDDLRRHHDLSLRAFEVLLFLAAFAPEGSMTITELTVKAPLSQSRVSRLVADLETRGLVARCASDTDARSAPIAITETGERLFRVAQETHLAGLHDRLFGVLSETEIRQIGRITAKITTACSPD
jgi:DNA-binding MarR family transcriptional regulator